MQRHWLVMRPTSFIRAFVIDSDFGFRHSSFPSPFPFAPKSLHYPRYDSCGPMDGTTAAGMDHRLLHPQRRLRPALSAERLLAHVLQYSRIKLYTDYERPLTTPSWRHFEALVQRAAEQEPIEYLTGIAHFFGLEFEVNRDVLIPRPDTETLVENVLQLSRNTAGMESPRCSTYAPAAAASRRRSRIT